jgi:hypothetical protein
MLKCNVPTLGHHHSAEVYDDHVNIMVASGGMNLYCDL